MFDIAIIGAGPAGMTAALYGARAGLNMVIFEKSFPGGQMVYANLIENFPGSAGISGADLAMNMKKQIKEVQFETAEILDVDFSGERKLLKTSKDEFEAKAVVIATGAFAKKLGIENETKFLGRGVSYCATCDGALYRNKKTLVVGGGNTAMDDALYLSNFCEKVTLIHRRDTFRGDKITLDKLKEKENIEVLQTTVLSQIIGDKAVSAVEVVSNGMKRNIEVDGLFIAVGYQPNTDFLKELIHLNGNGEIVTNDAMETNIPLVYAIGDVRQKELKQIVTACADGANVIDQIRRKL